jgi:hypothetical protein
MMLVTGIVGVAMLLVFMGILAWWIRELSFTIIVVAVLLMALYDLVRTLRHGDSGPGR